MKIFILRKDEYKHYLFVYKIIKVDEYDIWKLNQINRLFHPILFIHNKLELVLNKIDWYNKIVSRMNFIDENIEGRRNCKQRYNN